MIPRLPQRKATSLLGLALDGDRLEGTLLRRTNGHLEIRKAFSVTLSLDPLTNDPQLVGRELRGHLDSQGIGERRCAVSLPLGWALTLSVELPNLPEADLESCLQLEAERGFPYPPDGLCLAVSRLRTPGGAGWATLVAVPREHVRRLEAALAAAQLRPVSFSLGITAVCRPADPRADGVLALVPGPRDIQVQATVGGGIAALRTLEGAFETAGGVSELQADLVLRELRITLGQLSPEIRGALRRIEVYGAGEPAERLVDALRPRAPGWDLALEHLRTHPPESFRMSVAPSAPVSGALGLAVRHLGGEEAALEFLPPRVTVWKRFLDRYSTRKLAWTCATAGTAALLVAGGFLIQQARLWNAERRWQTMSAKVLELEGIQKQIRAYRPWFDESCRSLQVLKRLTEAFPEDGSVSAKSVEMRGASMVICSGTARDRQALFGALERLGGTEEVADLKLEQMRERERAPMEFTFNFQWNGGTTP